MIEVQYSRFGSWEERYHWTLEELSKLSRRYAGSPVVRELAMGLIRNCREYDYSCQLLSIFQGVRDRVRFLRDPKGLEWVQTPVTTLRVGVGDCDCQSLLVSSIAEALGLETRFRTGAIGRNTFPGHVWAEVYHPGERRWVKLDTTWTEIDALPPNVTEGSDMSGALGAPTQFRTSYYRGPLGASLEDEAIIHAMDVVQASAWMDVPGHQRFFVPTAAGYVSIELGEHWFPDTPGLAGIGGFFKKLGGLVWKGIKTVFQIKGPIEGGSWDEKLLNALRALAEGTTIYDPLCNRYYKLLKDGDTVGYVEIPESQKTNVVVNSNNISGWTSDPDCTTTASNVPGSSSIGGFWDEWGTYLIIGGSVFMLLLVAVATKRR